MSRWGARVEPERRKVTLNANDISVGVDEAHGSRQTTSEKNSLTKLKAQAGEGVMASVVLHKYGIGNGMVEKKEEKMMVSRVGASVQAKSQTNGTESMTRDKSIDQKEKSSDERKSGANFRGKKWAFWSYGPGDRITPFGHGL